jgi:hypothetical protein
MSRFDELITTPHNSDRIQGMERRSPASTYRFAAQSTTSTLNGKSDSENSSFKSINRIVGKG